MQPQVILTTNDYGIQMLEIKPTTKKGRSTFISLKKANAIVKASDTDGAWIEVHKYGRDLRQINLENGKNFLVGDTKLDAVLGSLDAILAISTALETPKATKKKKSKAPSKIKVS